MATEKRYVYLVSCSYELQGRDGGSGSHIRSVEIFRSNPIMTLDDVYATGSAVTDSLRDEYPGWDAAFPGWRQTVLVLACSLLRVEEQRDGEWVLREHQPWGRVDT